MSSAYLEKWSVVCNVQTLNKQFEAMSDFAPGDAASGHATGLERKPGEGPERFGLGRVRADVSPVQRTELRIVPERRKVGLKSFPKVPVPRPLVSPDLGKL